MTKEELCKEYAQAIKDGDIDDTDIDIALECGCNDPFEHNHPNRH